jgi:hypothetical protein
MFFLYEEQFPFGCLTYEFKKTRARVNRFLGNL